MPSSEQPSYSGSHGISLKTQFDTKLEEAIGEYEDGKKIAGDIPAYLALGVGYSPVNAVRVNVGFHWFDDKHATSYNNRQREVGPWYLGVQRRC